MKSLMTGMLLAFILIATSTSCSDRNAAQKVAAKVKPTPKVLTARVQLASYDVSTGVWEPNPYAPVQIQEVSAYFEVGDIIGDKLMILSFPDDFRGDYSFTLEGDDSLLIHNNATNTTLGFIRGRENPTLDSLLIYDND